MPPRTCETAARTFSVRPLFRVSPGYIAALAMTTSPSDKPFNDARHAVVVTLSDLVHALETDPTAQQEKIDKAKGAIRNLVWDLKASQELRLSAEGD